jgi:hypothetical protein
VFAPYRQESALLHGPVRDHSAEVGRFDALVIDLDTDTKRPGMTRHVDLIQDLVGSRPEVRVVFNADRP